MDDTLQKHRCLCCGCALTTSPSPSAVLAMHLRQLPACRRHYVKYREMIGVGDSGRVIVATLHAYRNASRQWGVRGISPSGNFVTAARCRGKKDAQKKLVAFCVKPQLTDMR